ncbi:MAG: stage 0 sporulation family protein [Clostridia bacterium]|nr:stage 0 sporulation family protein [Clostridia bacterium]
MVKIIGVRFKEGGKVYYFDPCELTVNKGDKVVVDTAHGIECGECTIPNGTVEEEKIVAPLKKAIRVATAQDEKKYAEKLKKQETAIKVCEEKIIKHGLDMKLVEAECAFDGSKIIFYFTSDGRVDFRELVKDLAGHFRTRIELRQIGVRDEAKMIGGLGICGREFCCKKYLSDFQPVSIKMAKEQGLSLNPTKISGTCGRLMCCLKHEQDAYEHLNHITPRIGSYVKTPSGNGIVRDVALLKGIIKVQLDKEPDSAPVTFKREEVRLVRSKNEPNDKIIDNEEVVE